MGIWPTKDKEKNEEEQTAFLDEEIAMDDDELEIMERSKIDLEDDFDPKIVVVKGVKYKTHKYKTKSGMFSHLIPHYTVSGRNATSAKGVLKYLASKGYGALVMDEDGIIYIPENFDIFRDATAHAGKSKWNGKSNLNDYALGMEICCLGKDSKVGPFRESKGEANIIKGKYQQYTPQQEQALINFVHWAKKKNEEYELANTAGHDEVRTAAGFPGGKSDPGASLSMTMPEFRELIGAGQPASIPVATPVKSAQYPTIRLGSTGIYVGKAQLELTKRNLPLVVDESFGPKTKEAVIQFQSKNDLVADGVIGPKTWKVLLGV